MVKVGKADPRRGGKHPKGGVASLFDRLREVRTGLYPAANFNLDTWADIKSAINSTSEHGDPAVTPLTATTSDLDRVMSDLMDRAVNLVCLIRCTDRSDEIDILENMQGFGPVRGGNAWYKGTIFDSCKGKVEIRALPANAVTKLRRLSKKGTLNGAVSVVSIIKESPQISSNPKEVHLNRSSVTVTPQASSSDQR
jgi:hypothetical protein